VLKYVNRTKQLGIILRAYDPTGAHAYIDAAYGVHNDGKSIHYSWQRISIIKVNQAKARHKIFNGSRASC
jgi:hypothetical protein